jgi:penicillin-binding protein 2
MIAEQALRQPLLGRASAIVVDPNNGDILAMASIPSFDPNVFIPSVSAKDWGALNKDPAVPLVDRAVSGFPPGSTFKIVTALAGLTKGMAGAHFNCPGSINYYGRPFHCWIAEKGGSHGVLGLADALKVSCDCFFYQYGNAAGIDAIDQVGALLGFGKTYDIGLSDEKAGIMPGPEWMKEHYPKEKWSTAYTANVSIGQGFVLASPLQLAMAYATVANGGVCYTPRLVKTVLNPDGTPTLDDNGNVAVPDQPKIRGDLRQVVKQSDIEVVRKGLWEVVNERGGPGGGGTGAKGQIKGTVVAGKTGTADASEHGKKETIAWFCCFAPYDHPKYVVVAMVQGGKHGGSVAGPVASHILSQILAMDQGTYSPQLVSLAPADNPHAFNEIDALPDYTDNAPALVASGDESATDNGPGAATPEMGGGSAAPDIKTEADAQGNVKEAVRKAAMHKAAPPAPDRRSLMERIFHPRQSNQPTQQSSGQRPHWPF